MYPVHSSGAFLSASEDSTGTLEFIENKIARATMLPRSHGEASSPLFIIPSSVLVLLVLKVKSTDFRH